MTIAMVKKRPYFPPSLFFILILFVHLFRNQLLSEELPGDSIPIIYSPRYNISILGIENFHPFDSKKFMKVYRELSTNKIFDSLHFYTPAKVSSDELYTVHTQDYLLSLKKPRTIATIIEIPPLRIIPLPVLEHGILTPMRLGTGGTILGAHLAMRYGWAINLSGGYHHAKADQGGGFCVFADVPIALHSLWKEKPGLRVLIVDLDVHQGNGNSSILGDDHRVAILDMYNKAIYPYDSDAAQKVKYPVPLTHRTNTRQYLDSLYKWLPFAIADFNPQLIVYNAGTDIFVEDRMGNFSVTEEGIFERDRFVFETALSKNIPILMVLSGGYTKKSGHIIAKSIVNILENMKLIKQ